MMLRHRMYEGVVFGPYWEGWDDVGGGNGTCKPSGVPPETESSVPCTGMAKCSLTHLVVSTR